MVKQSRIFSASLVIALAACSDARNGVDSSKDHPAPSLPPAKIAILTIQSGPAAHQLEPAVQWAIDNVNAVGGAGGRLLEAMHFDLLKVRPEEVEKAIFDDPNVVGLTGIFPASLARRFIIEKRLLISSMSTGADIYRKYAGTGFIWRSVESDSAQSKLLLLEAAKNGGRKVALLADMKGYGETFFDWFGFFTEELDLQPGKLVRFADATTPCDKFVDEALVGEPDRLVVAMARIETVICVVKRLKERRLAGTLGGKTKLVLSDSAFAPSLIEELGADAEGLVGYIPSEDPVSGFTAAYLEKTGGPPPSLAPNTYDAILLMAYALEVTKGKIGGELDSALRKVVSGRGILTGWDSNGVAQTLMALRHGEEPDISGATGKLNFDSEFYTDPTGTYYARWEVKNGAFLITDYITTAGLGGQTVDGTQSVARTLASESHRQDIEGGIKTDLPPKDQSWALVAATSSDWQNYRHQADALAQYTMLKAQGFDDDHIVLVIRDDISTSKKNPLPGQIRTITMGANLRENARIDYPGAGLNATSLMGILKGDPAFPERINSDFDDNIYVFLVGHGGNQGMFVDINEATYSVSSGENILSPSLLANTIAEMHKAKRYRRMLIVVEACHSGVLGASLTSPNALLLTAASASENSLATNYALEIGEWVADQFAFSLYQLSTTEPTLPLPEIYRRVYSRVSGSHVSVFNTKTFSELAVTTLDEFIRP